MIRVIENVIYDKDVEADPRYEEVSNILPRYFAKEFVRTLMKLEQEGKTESVVSVKESFAQDEGLTLNEMVDKYIEALDVCGYRVYKKETKVDKTHGYTPVRSGSMRVRTKTNKYKYLYFRRK